MPLLNEKAEATPVTPAQLPEPEIPTAQIDSIYDKPPWPVRKLTLAELLEIPEAEAQELQRQMDARHALKEQPALLVDEADLQPIEAPAEQEKNMRVFFVDNYVAPEVPPQRVPSRRLSAVECFFHDLRDELLSTFRWTSVWECALVIVAISAITWLFSWH